MSLMAVGFRESIVRCDDDDAATGPELNDRPSPNPGRPTVHISRFQGYSRGASR